MAFPAHANLLRMSAHRGRLVVQFCAASYDEDCAQGLAVELLETVQRHGLRELHLDLGEVTFLSSSLLGSLVVLDRKLKDAGGHLAIVHVNPGVYELFVITRLVDILDVREKEVVYADV